MFRSPSPTLILAVLTLLSAPAAAAPGIALIWSATTGSGSVGGSLIDAQIGDVLTLDVVVTPDTNGVNQMSSSLAFDPSILTALAAVECPAPPNLSAGTCNDTSLHFANPFTLGVGNPSASSSAGDFDANGGVGSSDVALFIPNFGLGVPPASPIFDLDNNGVIALPDFSAAFGGEFGYPGSPGIVSGGVEIFEASAWPSSLLSGSFTLGRVDLEVVGSGTSAVDVVFLPTIDGIVDGNAILVADSTNPAGATLTSASVTVPLPIPSMSGGLLVVLAAALLGASWLLRGFVKAGA